jgi:acyl-CoA synthetase (AMP-forming)/AMP-acid ligase II
MVSVVLPLLAGGSTSVAVRFDVNSFWAMVERVRPTFFSAVPAIYAMLASRPGTQEASSTTRKAGENIYPKEIEDVLYGHPAVFEAAVPGRPHAIFGEQPVAFVVFAARRRSWCLRRGQVATPDDLVERCRAALARYKVP